MGAGVWIKGNVVHLEERDGIVFGTLTQPSECSGDQAFRCFGTVNFNLLIDSSISRTVSGLEVIQQPDQELVPSLTLISGLNRNCLCAKISQFSRALCDQAAVV